MHALDIIDGSLNKLCICVNIKLALAVGQLSADFDIKNKSSQLWMGYFIHA